MCGQSYVIKAVRVSIPTDSLRSNPCVIVFHIKNSVKSFIGSGFRDRKKLDGLQPRKMANLDFTKERLYGITPSFL